MIFAIYTYSYNSGGTGIQQAEPGREKCLSRPVFACIHTIMEGTLNTID